MGTEDYICVTLSGGAPWGFSLQRLAPEHPQLLTLTQVEPGGPAAEAGLCEGDELLSVNGLSCTGLSPPEVTALVNGTSSSLQLLVSRTRVSEELLSNKEQGFFEERKSEEEEGLESTTLEIWPARHSLLHGELHICDSQDENEAYSGEAESDADTLGHACQGCSRGLDAFSPGAVVELQLSLSDHSADDAGDPATLTNLSGPQAVVHTATFSHAICNPALTSQPQVEVTLQWPHRGCQEAGPEGRGVESEGGGEESEASGKGGSSEEGGPEEVPSPSVVSLSSSAEELDSEPEKDPGKPNKHRARHARFRRSESQSEKQLKEAKCKCRRIALLLTAAPNPNNKGVLMFKKHRQRAKKYTLISYGTGEDASEDEDDEDGGQVAKEKHTVELTLLANSESELGEEHFVDAQGCSSTVTFDWDTGLLDIERKLEDLQEMDRLPETKGKGALMFAQRRQRMDEISAEHDEMRRKGMPVEGVQEIQSSGVLKMGPYQTEEQSYVQSVESRVYMDVNLQQQQQYQQQQQQYQQQLQQQEYQQQEYQQQRYQQQQYEQHQYQQLQQYQHSMNGMMHHQANDSQKSTIITNRTAKPFSGVQNTVPSPFPPSRGVSSEEQAGYIESQYSMVPPQSCSLMSSGEQIASRDERISVPAIKTGILQDTRKRSPSKPMFTFKEPPKVSPNPELLNLLNRSDKKTGFESGPEEDYLSLGAEACNFLQAPKAKQKIPPPVAPKPVINPASPPWSPPPESSSQVPSHSGEHSATAALSVSSPGTASAPILEKAPPSQLHATEDSQSLPEDQGYPDQSNMRSPPQDQELFRQPESAPVSGPQSQTDPQPPVSSWTPAQMQAQPQPPVTAWTQPPTQAHPQARTSTRAPSQPQPSPQQQPVNTWNQPQTQADSQPHESTWTQPQIQAQPQAPANTWTPSQPQPEPQAPVEAWSPAHVQTQQQPIWSSSAYPQPKPQSNVSSWSAAQSQSPHSAWTPGQTQGHAQSNWASSLQAPSPQSQPKAQSHVSSWPPPQPQAQPQSRSPWTSQMQQQPQEQIKPQSYVSSWPPVQTQTPSQPPWVSSQSQARQQAQMSSWASETRHIHPEPVGNSWAPAQRECQQQPSWISPPQHQTPLQTSVTQWSPALGQGQAQPPASTWTPTQTQSPSQLPWASTQQPSMSVWAPHGQQALLSATTFSQVPPSSQQPLKPWNQPQSATSATAPPPPQRMNSYTPSSPAITGGLGSAFEMPALRGKGAQLFAKRQSRMEKFVVDSSTVQANKVRSVSPTPSLPSSWKYTPNVRAPPPLSYNPIQSPSYPPGAVKQAPASSPAATAKGKGKEKAALKPLHALDVMKHQPYQLNSSLFTYGPAVEVKGPPAKPALTPTSVQSVKYEQFAPTQPSGPINSPYPLQAPYGTANVSSSVQDGPYHQGPSSSYQTGPNFQFNQHPSNPYQQPPDHYYQPMCSPPYQPDQNPPYQQAQNPAYLQPQSSPYQAGSIPSYEMGQDTPYQEAPALTYQSGPSVYASPSFQVPPKPASVSGAGSSVAPRPKFSAKKSAAQVWKPSAVAQE